jgi:outer membrane protein OmpA-like peptidoglycan-associated protein
MKGGSEGTVMLNLVDAVKGVLTPNVAGYLSRMTGESPMATASGLADVVPVVAAGIANKGSTTEGASGLLNMAEQSGLSSANLENPSALFSDPTALQRVTSGGGSILSSLFGDKLGMLSGMLGGQSGLGGKSTSMLMSFVAPIALGMVGKHARESGMSASDLAGGLSAQKSQIAGLLPAGVREMFGGGGDRAQPRVSQAEPVGDTVRTSSVEVARRAQQPRSRWPLGAAVGAVVLLLLLSLRGRQPPAPLPNRPRAPEGRDPGQRVARSGSASLDTLTQALRSGSSASVAFGTSSFERGSAELTSAGQANLQATASALRANPSSRAAISGGAGDVSGGEQSAVANARAKMLHDRLIGAGIDPNRVEVRVVGDESDTTVSLDPGK